MLSVIITTTGIFRWELRESLGFVGGRETAHGTHQPP